MMAMQAARAVAVLAAFGVGLATSSPVMAGVDPDRPGSILIFPKVVNTATRDTTLRIGNVGNLTNQVRCFYLNGTTCGSVDFDLTLTKQQPTQWNVSEGRAVNVFDPFGSTGAGLDPGLIPPVPAGFEGAVVCVEVVDDVPVAQNKLRGEAVIRDISGSTSRNTSTYNAIAITSGTGSSDSNNTLQLDASEYSQCNRQHRIDFTPDAIPGLDPVLGATSNVVTNVTVLPCDLDFSRRTPTAVTLNARLWNEFETETSSSASLSCWGTFAINPAPLAPPTTFATIEYTANRPVVMVVESVYTDTGIGASATAARNVHTTGSPANATIRLSATP